MPEYYFKADENDDGIRIDKCISDKYEELSRSYIQKIIKDGNVLINDICCKPSTVVNEYDEVKMITPEAVIPEIVPQDIPLDILYEDNDVIIVNKPKGMVVHPAPGHYDGTLVNALMYHCNDLSGINGVLRPGIVHRIDRDTTGSVIVCKNDIAHESIAQQLKEHSIERKYIAIIHGNNIDDTGRIDAPIGRSSNDRKKMAVVFGGKNAVTNYSVLERFDGYALVECRLETGRTHQIRVHMAHINHPILGDEVYCNHKNSFKLNGQCLHAMTLGFTHPVTGERIVVNAPIPEYMDKLINILRNK